SFELRAGEVLSLGINAQSLGSPLDSYLRVFDVDGKELASNDDQNGVDAALDFTAPADGTYFVGVSAFNNSEYDPNEAFSGAGLFTGPYQLTASTTSPLPDLVGTSFSLDREVVHFGDEVTVHYTVQNQGFQDSGPFDIAVRLSGDAMLTEDDVFLTTVSVSGLAAGASTSGSIRVQLPGTPGSPPSGFSDPSVAFLGLVI